MISLLSILNDITLQSITVNVHWLKVGPPCLAPPCPPSQLAHPNATSPNVRAPKTAAGPAWPKETGRGGGEGMVAWGDGSLEAEVWGHMLSSNEVELSCDHRHGPDRTLMNFTFWEEAKPSHTRWPFLFLFFVLEDVFCVPRFLAQFRKSTVLLNVEVARRTLHEWRLRAKMVRAFTKNSKRRSELRTLAKCVMALLNVRQRNLLLRAAESKRRQLYLDRWRNSFLAQRTRNKVLLRWSLRNDRNLKDKAFHGWKKCGKSQKRLNTIACEAGERLKTLRRHAALNAWLEIQREKSADRFAYQNWRFRAMHKSLRGLAQISERQIYEREVCEYMVHYSRRSHLRAWYVAYVENRRGKTAKRK